MRKRTELKLNPLLFLHYARSGKNFFSNKGESVFSKGIQQKAVRIGVASMITRVEAEPFGVTH